MTKETGFDVFTEYATDLVAEEEGVWRDLGRGARVKVARANNKYYARLLNKQLEQHRESLDNEGDVADAVSTEIMVDVVARTVLMDFEGIGFKGQPMTYSLSNAKVLLGIKDFRARVMTLANDFDAYKVKQEVEQGNV